MASETTIVVKHWNETNGTIVNLMQAGSTRPRREAQKLINFLRACNGGNRMAQLQVQVNTAVSVTASATITSATPNAADTVTIAGGTALAASATLQDATHFKIGATNTITAANLVTCINASAINSYVFATSSGAVVTVTASRPGILGNLVTLVSSNGTRLPVTGSGKLAGGSNAAPSALPTVYTYSL